MPTDGGDGNREPSSELTFRRALATLKQQGSMLLVVGAVPDDVHTSICTQMLGDTAVAPRRQVFVRTDTVCSPVVHRLSASGSPTTETMTQIVAPAYARSATGAQSVGGRVPEVRVEDASLPELADAITTAIEDHERRAGSLSPAELRVCFDSLTPMLEDHGRRAVFRFLHILAARIRAKDGQGHVHFPVDRESAAVALLEPLFDGIVELAVEDGDYRQRWHLREYEMTTDWLPL